MHKLLCIVFLFQLFLHSKAQFYTLPNNWLFQQIQDYTIFVSDTSVSTSVYPVTPFLGRNFSNIDTAFHLFKYIKNDPALDKLFEKDLILKRNTDFEIRIDPLLNFQKGYQTIDTNISAYTNTRGFIASFKTKNVYIETMLSENQSVFPEYLYNYSKNTQIVPGQGRWKLFKESGFDYSFSAGIVSVQVNKNITITLGTGKQKIGNGYRSLLLSDNAFVYPFAKVELNFWKGRLQYISNYAVLNNLTSASANIPPNTERLFQKKPMVYQYLNIGVTKHTRIGFFQGIIGESPNRNNEWKGDGILFSPILFTQLFYYGLDNKNNVLVGLDFRQKLLKTLIIYGQFVLDDHESAFKKRASYGYQIGLKWLKKLNDWMVVFLTEWNDVEERTYWSPLFDNYSNSAYSHFNQSMAYTPEHGKELVTIVSIKKRRWVLSGQYNYQQNSVYSLTTQYYKLLLGFVINPSYNLMVNFGLENRLAQKNNNYIYLQLQTSLYNIYYDF